MNVLRPVSGLRHQQTGDSHHGIHQAICEMSPAEDMSDMAMFGKGAKCQKREHRLMAMIEV